MAITRAQIVRELRRQGGIMGSNGGSMLVTPTRDGSRPGYYGPDAGFGDDDYKDASADFDAGSGSGGSDDDFARARSAIDARAAEAAEREQREREAAETFNKREIERKSLDRRKRMGAKYVTDMFDLPADYDEEKDDTAAMLDLFVNDPYREDRTKRTLPTPLGIGLSLLEKPLQAGAKKTRQFFSGPTTDIFGRKQKGVLAAGKFNYKGEPLTEERFANMSLTEKNQAYKDYMGQRLDNQIDAYGNPLNQGNDGPDNQILFPQNITPGDGDDSEEEDVGLRLAFRANGGRIGYQEGGMMSPEGGIMDLETGRQMYFLGKLVKKATKAVKKVVKSPIGKAALIAGLGYGLGGGTFFGKMLPGVTRGGQGFGGFGGLSAIFGNVGDIIGGSTLGDKFAKAAGSKIGLGITAASVLAGLLTPQQEEEAQQIADNTGIDIEEARNQILKAAAGQDDFRARAFKADGGIMRLGYDEAGAVMSEKEMKKLAKSSLYKGFKTMYGVSPEMAKENEAYDKKFDMFEQLYKKGFQKGGDVEPVAKKTMPLLDMGGKEMDLREDGGFVPIGRMEKADDVPARLSKNEFVFTADAVRNAGDGNVDKGAEVMYNMMKNLESGGDVSEESQGLSGAREMFQTSKRLEEVL
jgi:hypothetical protein